MKSEKVIVWWNLTKSVTAPCTYLNSNTTSFCRNKVSNENVKAKSIVSRDGDHPVFVHLSWKKIYDFQIGGLLWLEQYLSIVW